MNRRFFAMLLLTASACRRPAEEPRPAPTAKDSPSAESVAATLVRAAHDDVDTTAVAPLPASSEIPRPRLSLGERLAEEARTRPALAPRLELLHSALEARGITVVRTRQVLASAVDARYCALLASASGVVASVCEYDDAAAAARGRARSRAQFDALMPGRTLLTNDNTLLTLSPPPDARAHADAKLAEQAFAQLSPSARP